MCTSSNACKRTHVSTKDSPPTSNRLSDAPTAPADATWGRARESLLAVHRMVDPADLTVVFQPIVRLPTATPYGNEALVRCRQPQFSSPLVLFQQAVAANCAGRLGRMVREIAVPLAGRMPLFLNIHPQELNESWLVRPDDPIYGHDHELYLEITESVPLTHFELCLSILQEVRSRGGISLVVDDFGAGYSNLMRIADLEPRIVKLDRDLVAGIDRSARQQRLVKNVVRLCNQLDAQVCAEGVETEAEHSALIDVGVDFGQGHLYARPGYPIPSIRVPKAR